MRTDRLTAFLRRRVGFMDEKTMVRKQSTTKLVKRDNLFGNKGNDGSSGTNTKGLAKLTERDLEGKHCCKCCKRPVSGDDQRVRINARREVWIVGDYADLQTTSPSR